jgi:hypothetical protein
MTLQELEQVKKDLADGVIVSRQTWEKVLDEAIYSNDRLMAAFEADGFVGVELDRYDYACIVAEENGHSEPTRDDEIEGVRRLIDQHIANQRSMLK